MIIVFINVYRRERGEKKSGSGGVNSYDIFSFLNLAGIWCGSFGARHDSVPLQKVNLVKDTIHPRKRPGYILKRIREENKFFIEDEIAVFSELEILLVKGGFIYGGEGEWF